MKRLHQLKEFSHNLDNDWISWWGRHNLLKQFNLPFRISGGSPLRYPVFAVFGTCIIFLLLAPAILLMLIGTNLSHVITVIYTGLVILAMPTLAVYGIKRSRSRKQSIQRYLDEHPERKY